MAPAGTRGTEFTRQDWSRVQARHEAWWDGALEGPLISIRIPHEGAPRRPSARYGFQRFTSNYRDDASPEDIVESWEHELDRWSFHGDAFPAVMPNFGPGVLAAYLGCDLHRGAETAWFHPREEVPLEDLHLQWNPREWWLQRTLAISRAAAQRFAGGVQIVPPDLGGVLDVLASFRPSGGLLTDLYDEPEHVHRLVNEIRELWFRAFKVITNETAATSHGYTCWTELLSREPYWMLQCDFAYMISPAMFRQFALPDLTAAAARLARPFYHLDGPGQLDKLDMILSIPNLRGVQWIPGAGQRDVTHWREVYRRIHEAGKLIQVFTFQSEKGFRLLDDLVEQIGTPRGIALLGEALPHEAQEVGAMLQRYQAYGGL